MFHITRTFTILNTKLKGENEFLSLYIIASTTTDSMFLY